MPHREGGEPPRLICYSPHCHHPFSTVLALEELLTRHHSAVVRTRTPSQPKRSFHVYPMCLVMCRVPQVYCESRTEAIRGWAEATRWCERSFRLSFQCDVVLHGVLRSRMWPHSARGWLGYPCISLVVRAFDVTLQYTLPRTVTTISVLRLLAPSRLVGP